MSKPWFDAETGALLFEQYVADMPSFQRIMGDAVVTDEEVHEQARKVASLLKELEGALPPEAKALATDALCEWTVLYVLQIKRLESE